MTCSVCLIDHDDATHAATLRIRAALRARLALVLAPIAPGKRKPASAPHTPLAMIGHVPQRKRARRPCKCGGKHYAHGKCKTCYDARRASARHINPEACPDCDQPMLPPGVEKRPNEYDHASGCPREVNPQL